MSSFSTLRELLKRNLITKELFSEAIQWVTIYGKTIPYWLVKKGIFSEVNMVQLLQEIYSLSVIDRELFTFISKEVIKLIPKELAINYRLVPVEIRKGKLIVAMSDPGLEDIIKQIFQLTGYIVVPVITLESIIEEALNKYYSLSEEKEKSNGESYLELTRKKVVSTKELVPISSKSVQGKALHQSLTLTPEKVIEEIKSSKDRDKISTTIIEFLSQYFENVVMFIVKGGEIKIKEAKGGGFDQNLLISFSIPIDKDTILGNLYKEPRIIWGKLKKGKNETVLKSALGLKEGENFLLWPVLIKDRPVAIFYARGEKNPIPSPILLKRISDEASRKWTQIIIEKKRKNV